MIPRWMRRPFAPRTASEKFRWLARHAADARPAQNAGQRLVHDIWWLLAETANGSLSQYVTNSTGDGFAAMLVHLETIRAHETRAVLLELQRAAFAGDAVSRDRAERIRRFDAWEAQPGNEQLVSALSDRLLATSGHLTASVVTWAEDHRAYFPGYPA